MMLLMTPSNQSAPSTLSKTQDSRLASSQDRDRILLWEAPPAPTGNKRALEYLEQETWDVSNISLPGLEDEVDAQEEPRVNLRLRPRQPLAMSLNRDLLNQKRTAINSDKNTFSRPLKMKKRASLNLSLQRSLFIILEQPKENRRSEQ